MFSSSLGCGSRGVTVSSCWSLARKWIQTETVRASCRESTGLGFCLHRLHHSLRLCLPVTVITSATIEAVILRYPSLDDKWQQSRDSIVLKGDVIEYVLCLVHNVGPDMAPDYVTDAMRLNTLLCECDNYWKKLLRILAGHLRYELTDSKLPTCRDLAQLIGLAASASRLAEADVDRAFKYYTRGGEDALYRIF